MIDWDAHDEPDCIKPQGVALRTLGDALALLDQWIAAYEELEREANYYLAILKARDAQRDKL
jgi:hypothetical protein